MVGCLLNESGLTGVVAQQEPQQPPMSGCFSSRNCPVRAALDII